MSIRSFLQKAPDPLNLSGGGGGLDPLDLLGIPPMPSPPSVPQAPAFSAAMNITYKPTKTNFGSFDTPLMQAALDALHPAIPYKPPAKSGGGSIDPDAPGSHVPPISPDYPVNPRLPGGSVQPLAVVSRPTASPTTAFSRQYAKTPNTVVTRSAMTVPGTAVVTNEPASTAGIKPGLLAASAGAPR